MSTCKNCHQNLPIRRGLSNCNFKDWGQSAGQFERERGNSVSFWTQTQMIFNLVDHLHFPSFCSSWSLPCSYLLTLNFRSQNCQEARSWCQRGSSQILQLRASMVFLLNSNSWILLPTSPGVATSRSYCTPSPGTTILHISSYKNLFCIIHSQQYYIQA